MGEIVNREPSYKVNLKGPYPIQDIRQVLSEADSNRIINLINEKLNSIKQKINTIIDYCTEAQNYCGLDSFYMVDETGNQINIFPEKIKGLSSIASDLSADFARLQGELSYRVNSCYTEDNKAYKKWKNYQEDQLQSQAASNINTSGYNKAGEFRL